MNERKIAVPVKVLTHLLELAENVDDVSLDELCAREWVQRHLLDDVLPRWAVKLEGRPVFFLRDGFNGERILNEDAARRHAAVIAGWDESYWDDEEALADIQVAPL